MTGTVEDQRAWIEAYKTREDAGSEYYFVIERKDGVRCQRGVPRRVRRLVRRQRQLLPVQSGEHVGQQQQQLRVRATLGHVFAFL